VVKAIAREETASSVQQ